MLSVIRGLDSTDPDGDKLEENDQASDMQEDIL